MLSGGHAPLWCASEKLRQRRRPECSFFQLRGESFFFSFLFFVTLSISIEKRVFSPVFFATLSISVTMLYYYQQHLLVKLFTTSQFDRSFNLRNYDQLAVFNHFFNEAVLNLHCLEELQIKTLLTTCNGSMRSN